MSELRKVLLSFEDVLARAQANTELQREFARLNVWLAQFDKLEVEEVCSGSPSPARPAPARSQIDGGIVESYLARLVGSAGSRPTFEQALSELKTDKRVRNIELNEIAQRYVGGTSKYKNKTDAFKEMKLRFEAGISAANRLKASAEIF